MSNAEMTKAEKRRQRRLDKRGKQTRRHLELVRESKDISEQQRHHEPKPIEALNEAQGHYLLTIKSKQVTFGVGPAGTGKTFLAAATAADLLREGKIEKLIITRPAVEAEESLGFMPGDMQEKYAPYIAPVKGVLEERLGKGTLEYMVKSRQIEAIPLAFMRGHTFKNCWVILDEAQNATPGQMKMFLTRIGEHSRVIINGDVTQKDFDGLSGLEDALDRLGNSQFVGICEFDWDDVVRSGFVKEVLRAYSLNR